jgi:hypothetical protein
VKAVLDIVLHGSFPVYSDEIGRALAVIDYAGPDGSHYREVPVPEPYQAGDCPEGFGGGHILLRHPHLRVDGPTTIDRGPQPVVNYRRLTAISLGVYLGLTFAYWAETGHARGGRTVCTTWSRGGAVSFCTGWAER